MAEQGSVIGHAVILVDFIKEKQIRKFAEVGVWKGGTCKRILKTTADILHEYWAVDPWEVMDETFEGASRTQRRRTKFDWDEYHKHACSLMLYFQQLRVLRTTSELASSIFEDKYFDLVYLDAIHTFSHVDADIGFWLPKVKDGGYIAGHDYGSHRWPGVEEAVTKWFGKDIRLWEIDQVWMKQV
jgi:hypothetical protein